MEYTKSVEIAHRIQALLGINSGSMGDMCAQDVPLGDIIAVVSETEDQGLKKAIDMELERWID